MSRGLDPFKIAGASISGWYPSSKTASGRHPFTSLLELALGLYLEFHPLVVSYQRGDLSPEFARSHKLDVPLGAPYAIDYAFDGKPHEYLPDYVGTLRGGGLLVAEAGRVEQKAEARSRAKLAAAKRLTELKGGEVWIGTEESLSRRWQHNLIFLLTRRLGFPTFPELASHIVDIWRSEEACVAEVVARLGARWPEVEVEAAAWKVVGDSAAQGRVVIDFEGQALSLYTPLRLLSPAEPPILPSPLPHSLPSVESAGDLTSGEDSEELLQAGYLPGAVIDAGGIPSEEARATFLRNLAAVTDVLSGMALREASRRHGISPGQLSKLVKRGLKLGQIALVPYLSYEREPQLREEFRELIRRLYKRRSRPSITAVFEDPKLKRLAEELTQTEGSLVRLPTYWQVYRYIRSIENEPDVAVARSGSAHPPRPRTSPYSFVLSIPAPALLCQVDEHYLDVLVVALDGTVITNRVHAAVLICVKTAAILGAVLCLDTLREEDYMRLVRQAIEPKDRLVALYGCKHPWPCHGKPSVIFHDRGKVFTSERATRVLVDRLGIVTEEAPPYAPTAKGTVEALFAWVERKLIQRLPGTTKSDPAARGAYDSVAAAQSAGITLDVLEGYFARAIIDGYMREWDQLRGQARITLWEDAVRESGVPRYLGSPDDLTLLLMKAVNRRNPSTGRYAIQPGKGISFLGRWYVSPGLLDRLRGKEIDIYYDRRDISVIYLFLDGAHIGEAYCAEFGGRRVSEWEARALSKARTVLRREADEESRQNRAEILEDARRGRKAQYRESKRLEQARHMDLQRGEVHPSHVQAMLQAMQESLQLQGGDAAEEPPVALPAAVPNEEIRPLRRPAIRRREPDEQ